jgi:hypothetical protein
MYFQVYSYAKSYIEKGNGVFGEDKASTPLHQIIYPSPSLRTALQFGIIFTLILFAKGGQSLRRAYISLTSIRFWRFMPKGDKVLAQSKRTAPPPISKMCSFNLY